MFNTEDLFLFKNLTPKEKNEIIKTLEKPVAFLKGSIIYSEDNFKNAIGFVLEGNAFAVMNNGNGIFENSFFEGDCFGAAALFENSGTYVSTISARTDLKILFINESTLRSIIKKYPQVSINYISFLTDRIRFLNKKLVILTVGSSEKTLLQYLNTVKNDDGIVALPKNMTVFSKMLGISRATLYRSFDSLEKAGIIIKEKKYVKVI